MERDSLSMERNTRSWVGSWVEHAFCRENTEPWLKSSSQGNSPKPLENESGGPARTHTCLEGLGHFWVTMTYSDTVSIRLLAG